MYLIDTNVISEVRKRSKANPGVVGFFDRVARTGDRVYVSVVTVGELRRGIEIIRRRGDAGQATLLEEWLAMVLDQYADHVLGFEWKAGSCLLLRQIQSLPLPIRPEWH